MKIPTSYKVAILGLLALAAIICPKPAHANIGETYAQSCQRYGKPAGQHNGAVEWFMNNDYSILASFDDAGGRCDEISYAFWGQAPSEGRLMTLLAFNLTRGDNWHEVPVDLGRFWDSASRITALLTVGDPDAKSGRKPLCLNLWSRGHHERYEAAKAKSKTQQNAEQNNVTPVEQLPNI